MVRMIRAGLIQASVGNDAPTAMESLKKYLIEKHIALIENAADQGVEVLCLQELFYGPYFCAEQDQRWHAMAEGVPDGPTVRLMQDVAKRHGMALIVPIYEESMPGVYYNTAAVLDSDGSYLGKYRKEPHPPPGTWFLGEVLLQAGELWLPGVPGQISQNWCVYLLRSALP